MPTVRILVVDDEPDVREICSRGLRQMGYDVTKAASGQEAVAMAKQEPFDILLVDIMMPGMDGLQTFQAIKSLQPDIMGVIMTAYASVSNAVEAVNLGLSGFLLKPFALPELEAAVSEALAKREQEMDQVRVRTLAPLVRLATSGSETDPTIGLRNLAQVAMEETHSAGASVVLVARAEGEQPLDVSCGRCVEDLVDLLSVVGETSVARVFIAGEEPEQEVNAALNRADLECLVLVPIALPQRTLGFLSAGRDKAAPCFSSGDVEVLKVLAAQAAIVLSNAQLFRQVLEGERLSNALQSYLSPRTVQAVLHGASDPGVVGEPGLMTVLLTDVCGFSTLVEDAELADIIQVLHEYFSNAVEIISAHQGVVDELSGDEILASFDQASGRGNDALRAVKTGLEILERLDELREEWIDRGLPTFDVGIGISSGLVAVSSIGSGQRRALITAGRILNLAARSQAMTRELGLRLIITQDTFDQVRDVIKYRELGAVALRGIEEPVGLYGVYGTVGVE